MFYGASTWDPALIVSQILAVQCLFYVSLAFLMLLAFGAPNAATPHPSLEPRGALTQPCGAGPLAPNLSLALLFDYTRVSAHSLLGWTVIAANLVNAACGAVCLALVVQRAKKCLDFAATTYLLHLLLCAAYAGWPVAFEWWALNAGCLVLMAVLGEYVCMRRELREIPLTSGAGLGGLSMGSRAQAGGARGLLAISAIGSRVGGLLSGGLALSQAGGVVHGSSP